MIHLVTEDLSGKMLFFIALQQFRRLRQIKLLSPSLMLFTMQLDKSELPLLCAGLWTRNALRSLADCDPVLLMIQSVSVYKIFFFNILLYWKKWNNEMLSKSLIYISFQQWNLWIFSHLFSVINFLYFLIGMYLFFPLIVTPV